MDNNEYDFDPNLSESEEETTIEDTITTMEPDYISVSRVSYDPSVDAVDPGFKDVYASWSQERYPSTNYLKYLVYTNITKLLSNNGDTDISINNENSITSNRCRVEFVDKLSKEKTKDISVDPNRSEGLIIVVRDNSINFSNTSPVIFDRWRKYNERIIVMKQENLELDMEKELNNVNGFYSKITLTRETDTSELEMVYGTNNIPQIPYGDLNCNYLRAMVGDVISIETDTSKIYKLVTLPIDKDSFEYSNDIRTNTIH